MCNKIKKKFITSALPYVNNQPHLGNIIGSLLSADVYARFCRKMGYSTVFISGTDEYGTATEMEAIKQGILPLEIVEKNRKIHRKIYNFFNLSFDFFGQTHCEAHKLLVQEIFLKTIDYFEERLISMHFCDNCKQFLADRYVKGECSCGATASGDQCDDCNRVFKDATELKNSKCAICGNRTVLKNSKHLFLRLDQLQRFVQNLDTKYWSKNAVSIYKNWVNAEILPRCMTRRLKYKWGVPVPLKNYEDAVFYVWFDAPIGYLTFLQQKKGLSWLKNADWVQFMGKDNVPFHSIMFPSVLYALKQHEMKEESANSNKERSLLEKIEDLQLTERKDLIGSIKSDLSGNFLLPTDISLDFNIIISATDYLTFKKKKFSKSKRIGIFGMDLIEKNIGDVTKWKFYLLRKRPETKDSDFSVEEFIEMVNNELIANLGNFINRTLKFIEKKQIDVGEEISKHNLQNNKEIESFIEQVNEGYKEFLSLMDKIQLRAGLLKVLEMSQMGNKFLQGFQGNKQEIPLAFSVSLSLVQLLGHCFESFLPEAAEKLFKIINKDSELFPKEFVIKKDIKLESKVEVLFNKFSDEQETELNKFI
ncbi:methionine-tRNA ligase [Nucleospora cyclopteri]